MRAVKKAVQTTKLLDKEEALDKKLRGHNAEDPATPEEPAEESKAPQAAA